MKRILDATSAPHTIGPRRSRLVSLVPSTTETLFEIGAGDRVVGVTRFCVRPERARRDATTVGGTKSPDVEALLALEPDLVFANQEENRREDVERLRERVPVYVAFPKTVPAAIDDVRSAGRLLELEASAEAIAEELERKLSAVRAAARAFRYLYLIWQRPYMVAGPSTFVEGLLAEAGGINAAPRDRGRYPELTLGEIDASGADVVLLSSEPFPFETAHAADLATKLDPDVRVRLVDGQRLSWHGTRLLEGLPYLENLLDELRG
jgi:ABC-type Fe3+-hydroxamate transport system substrate-binding protein